MGRKKNKKPETDIDVCYCSEVGRTFLHLDSCLGLKYSVLKSLLPWGAVPKLSAAQCALESGLSPPAEQCNAPLQFHYCKAQYRSASLHRMLFLILLFSIIRANLLVTVPWSAAIVFLENIRKVLLDQAKGLSSLASYCPQWPASWL